MFIMFFTERSYPKMAHSKKSRKVGQIGIPKSKEKGGRKPSTAPKRTKPTKGKPAGSRHSVVQETAKGVNKAKKDPKIGSKKPIELRPAPKPDVKVKIRKFATPAAELAALEADERLHTLLERLDNDEKLSAEDQEFVNNTMARHAVLCDLLGIKDEEETAPESNQMEVVDDPLAALDAININDFR